MSPVRVHATDLPHGTQATFTGAAWRVLLRVMVGGGLPPRFQVSRLPVTAPDTASFARGQGLYHGTDAEMALEIAGRAVGLADDELLPVPASLAAFFPVNPPADVVAAPVRPVAQVQGELPLL